MIDIDFQMKVETYRQKALRDELTLEEMREAISYLRARRGKVAESTREPRASSTTTVSRGRKSTVTQEQVKSATDFIDSL